MMADGRQFTCEMCGKKEFFPWDESGTTLVNYDTSGWDIVCYIGNVCPECSKAYHTQYVRYMDYIVGKKVNGND